MVILEASFTKIGCTFPSRTPFEWLLFFQPGQFDFARSALRNVRRKALRSVAGSCSGPALTPYNSRSKARTVVPDARAVSA